ncbi:MAG: glutamate formiminotransferase / 5-formyltetrahydrofolate cyclo-ligase [Acidimicrobiaceae bacterium]
MLECVVNVSEGHDVPRLWAIAAAAGSALLDVHRDEHHNRAVLTVAGDGVEDAAREVARATVRILDVSEHSGAHPRIGVLDVVPFAPLEGSTLDDAIAARDAFADWAASELELPCFLYGPDRSLPEVRRRAFTALAPDTGPATPHLTAGACAVGARDVLVAYNLWLADAELSTAKRIAAAVRSPMVRALGLQVGRGVQVSCNLIVPETVGPAEIYDRVALDAPVERAELVGLVPRNVLAAVPPTRWDELDLSEDRTIERRVEARLRQ